jgi:hypothetical protein
MSNDDFAEDLTSFFHNLSYVSEKTATTVVEELRVFRAKGERHTDFPVIDHQVSSSGSSG